MADPSQSAVVFGYAPVAYVPSASVPLPEGLRGCGPYVGCVSDKTSSDPMFLYPNKEAAERFMAGLRKGTTPPTPAPAAPATLKAETLVSKMGRK